MFSRSKPRNKKQKAVVPDDPRRLIDPSAQITFARLAEKLRCKQDELPRWLRKLVEDYGVDCFERGVKHAYDRNTTKPRDPGWDEVTPVRTLWKE